MGGNTRHERVSTTKNALPCVLEMLRHSAYVNVLGEGVTYVVFPWDLLNYNFALLNPLLYPEHMYVDMSDLPQAPTVAYPLCSIRGSADV